MSENINHLEPYISVTRIELQSGDYDTAIPCYADSEVCDKLPDGYFYTDAMTIRELAETWDTSGLHPGITPEGASIMVEPEGQEKIYYIGVREEHTNQLVGTGNVHLYESAPAYLGGLAVSPDHQHRGVGKAIILSRIAIAEFTGASMYTILKYTNPLARFYEQHGFEKEQASPNDYYTTYRRDT